MGYLVLRGIPIWSRRTDKSGAFKISLFCVIEPMDVNAASEEGAKNSEWIYIRAKEKKGAPNE
jgi:hypothetical protein